MIAALQKSRSDAPPAPASPPAGPVPPQDGQAAGPGGELVDRLQAMDGKLDQILKLVMADQQEDAGDGASKNTKEAAPNDDGY